MVCGPEQLPPGIQPVEPGWRCFKVQGPLDFNLTGILTSLLDPLARAEIPVFVLSTFDTDYIMVRQELIPAAVEALQREGHVIEG